GCAYECDYCGGSKKAFREAGDRRGLTMRSRTAIARDLKILAKYTDYVFLGNEPSKRHMYGVLEHIANDPELARRFRCGYNTFQLMDDRLLELIPRAFRTSHDITTIVEIAPETTIEADRAVVRDAALYYSNDQLMDSVIATQERIPGAQTVVYFSRYHQTHTKSKLIDELANIHDMRCRLYDEGLSDRVVITYCYLSTDVGSANWDQLPVQIGKRRTGSTEMLLRHIRRYERGQWPNPPIDGLCIYRPPDIDDAFEVWYMRLAQTIELLLEAGPYYYVVSRAIGFDRLIEALGEVVEETRELALGAQVTLHIVDRLHHTIARRWPELHAQAPGLFTGALAVARGILMARNTRDVSLPPIAGEQLITVSQPVLERSRCAVVDYPVHTRTLYRRLADGLSAVPVEPTLYIFCPSGPRSFARRFAPVLEALDGRTALAEVLAEHDRAGLFDSDEGATFHDFVIENYYHFAS
ncbi:MAG: hypothetical protein AAGC55_20330, partial [Myxococcota bacterium]